MIRDALARATAYDLAVSVPYALAVLFVAAEVAWLARVPGDARRVLRAAATASGMAAGAFVVSVGYTRVLRVLWDAVATARWDALAAFWAERPVLGAVAAFVAWDASGWLYHVIGHRTSVGWAAHSPHHSGEGYDATLGLRQSWAPFHGLLHHPLLALAGFDLRVVIVCAALSNCWQVMEHTSLPVRFPRWFAAAVMTPAAHRHHHGRDGGAVNLGPFLTVWDRLAGTWVPADAPAPAAYGPRVAAPANPVAVELAGWVALVSLHRPAAADDAFVQPASSPAHRATARAGGSCEPGGDPRCSNAAAQRPYLWSSRTDPHGSTCPAAVSGSRWDSGRRRRRDAELTGPGRQQRPDPFLVPGGRVLSGARGAWNVSLWSPRERSSRLAVRTGMSDPLAVSRAPRDRR